MKILSITFQGQKIKAGSKLYSFKFYNFIEVLGLTECNSGRACVVFSHNRKEHTLELSADRFCTIPTDKEVMDQNNQNNRKINSVGMTQTYTVCAGDPTKNPDHRNILFEGVKKAAVQVLSDCSEEKTFVIWNLKGCPKTLVPTRAFLNVFFGDRKKELAEEICSKIRIAKAVEGLLMEQYKKTFVKIGDTFQQIEGLSFVEYLAEKELI